MILCDGAQFGFRLGAQSPIKWVICRRRRYLGDEEDLSLESVAKRIDEICNEDDYVVPDNVDQEMQLLLEHLHTGDT